MNVQVINISKEYEPILGFLFPTYSITDSPAVTTKFIVHRDVKSKAERDALDVRYDDCVFISTQIFDEFWNEDVIKQKVIEFSRKKFKNRKTKFEPSKTNFIEDCIKFIFDMTSAEEETSINELFDSFGSALFVSKFIKLTAKVPTPVLISSMNTFIQKVIAGDSSVFYKKKSILFKDKIKRNMMKSLDEFNMRDHDPYGLSQVKLFSDLVQ